MTDFKVGDKVRIVANKCASINKVGDVGVITDIKGSGFLVDCGRGKFCNWSKPDDLELIVKPTNHQDLYDALITLAKHGLFAQAHDVLVEIENVQE